MVEDPELPRGCHAHFHGQRDVLMVGWRERKELARLEEVLAPREHSLAQTAPSGVLPADWPSRVKEIYLVSCASSQFWPSIKMALAKAVSGKYLKETFSQKKIEFSSLGPFGCFHFDNEGLFKSGSLF